MRKLTKSSQCTFQGNVRPTGRAWPWYVAVLGVGIVGASLANYTAIGAVAERRPSDVDLLAPAPPQVHFSQTTFNEMLAFHRANPNVTPTVPPSMEAPPPGIVPFVGAIGQALMRGTVNVQTPTPGPESEPLAPPLIVNFAGTLDNGTNIPPDTMGAVGPAHIVNMLNSGFQVFDRTGGIVAPQISLQAFWAVLGTGAGQPAADPYDPKILYDQHSGRWVVVTDSNAFSTATRVLVGISVTSDPTGAWNLFAIDPDPGALWADYPGLGVDAANVYVSQNMFTIAGAFSAARFWVISKASMIAGGPLSVGVRTPPTGGFGFQPAHSFDNDPGGLNYYLDQGWHIGGTPVRALKLTRITGIGAAAVMTELGFIEVSGYNFAYLDAPQLDCATDVETNDARIINAVLRNGKVWTTHTVGDGEPIDPAPATKPEVAWYEMDPSLANLPGPYLPPIQQGHVEHPTLAYYFPSIAVNAVECVALGFSGSDAATFASAYYTLRDSTDSPGTMQSVELLKAGEASYLKIFGGTRNRWGDYSATMVDPLDDLTFWTTQEYAETPFFGGPTCVVDGGRWGLWWGSFQCVMPPPPPMADPTGVKKSRFISFSVPGGATPPETALRVKLTSLHHPDPVYTGGTTTFYTLFEGQSMWVGPPVLYFESGTSGASFMASTLQCAPYYQDWSTISLLHVTGEAITPSSSFDVENLAGTCLGSEATCTVVSTPLTIVTARSGDVIINELANFADISALVAKFQAKPGAPIKARAKLAAGDARGLISIAPNVGFADIAVDVDAFKGKAYPYKPGKCTGNPAKACISDADCTTQGTTGPCILCP